MTEQTETSTGGRAPVLAAVPAGRPEKTALDRAIEADRKLEIYQYVKIVAGRRGVRGAEADDVTSEAYKVAFVRERKGQCWDPAKCDARVHIAGILLDVVLANRRKRFRKGQRPGLPLGEELDVASTAEGPDEQAHVQRERARLASSVQAALAAQTRGGLTMKVVDAWRRGIHAHERLAADIGCSLAEVRSAVRRLSRRIEKVLGGDGEDAS